MAEELEFVFSFRSPYAWIAARHVLPQVHPDTRVRWTPFLPLPSFPNFSGSIIPAKARHNVQDILRLTRAYDLSVGRPPVDEPDWKLAHAAFLWADRQGAGPAFAAALMEERWCRSQIISAPDAIARIGATIGVDPREIVSAASSDALQSELITLVQTNYDERDIFGVPMFILPSGEHFWGHDRMEWALRHGFVRAAG